jgi:alanyl-tRNA synthetase
MIIMDHREIARKFLDYFKRQNHMIIEDSSLIPKEYDPSALFVNSGMHPLKPYFIGVLKPPSKRLANMQRCLRTVDIDKVGNKRTLTFFFMLGSWSIGDYWKEDAVRFALELLTKGFGLEKERLWPTVFAGDKKIPKDEETIEAWLKAGIPREKIVELPAENNFWTSGPTGPCGPCTEIHYDRGKEFGCGRKECKPGCDCERFLEIWNAGVFMEYNIDENGNFQKLPFKSVDTGAGLERLAAVLQNKPSVYETTLFLPIVRKIEELSGKKYDEKSLEEDKIVKAIRVFADHIRASVFIAAEGIEPSKVERGYVLRRILRRMIRYGNVLELSKEDVLAIAETTIDMYGKDYSHIKKNRKNIISVISNEYDKFSKNLVKGLRRLLNLVESLKKEGKRTIPGIEAFHLYDTYGFPIELTKEIAAENGLGVDEEDYKMQFQKHQKISKEGVEQKFKSGLSEVSDATVKLHTATHLLHQALRHVLGKHVEQRGSNITPERLRFDFSHHKKMSEKELKEVESIVNKKIKEALEVRREEMTPEEAKKKGAIGLFEQRYGEKVSVYSIGDFSKEICAGPHVKNTKELGKFKIIKEEAVAAGVRRIKAKLEETEE